MTTAWRVVTTAWRVVTTAWRLVTTAWRLVRPRMKETNNIYKEMSAECTVVDLNEYLMEHSATGTNAGAKIRTPQATWRVPPPSNVQNSKIYCRSFELNSFLLTEGGVLRVTLQTILRSQTTVESGGGGGGVMATGICCTSGTPTKIEYVRALYGRSKY